MNKNKNKQPTEHVLAICKNSKCDRYGILVPHRRTSDPLKIACEKCGEIRNVTSKGLA